MHRERSRKLLSDHLHVLLLVLAQHLGYRHQLFYRRLQNGRNLIESNQIEGRSDKNLFFGERLQLLEVGAADVVQGSQVTRRVTFQPSLLRLGLLSHVLNTKNQLISIRKFNKEN
jgi:hypothetical protein